ncbi:Phosphoribosylamine--glycine ligase, putative [Perkinsus marinus ATCC 50983]|uniref:Phosphoribosylamine--glycine ligase, putative n=1 Tax=Perkinsus marinus (strain ATCC 50983 / TXsc) TaxID=423536 RepID=C5K9K1_PERM5|nr:Phosphoribosylamine--glycine ligase, putative [Perkinsus marinus ATCC 50983]EER18773.1 Phosphoribosylamine--glycine ligase, putative [Perkinsus marinus ATCC 50983]|eukprot:XP_002786977.1 Phosphoribosylamine--glycine ligase, putative [Perkinsus marinus ATCC 50983]
MTLSFDEALEVANNRPNEGSWQSPLAMPRQRPPSVSSLDGMCLEVVEDGQLNLDLSTPFMADMFLKTSSLPDAMTAEERRKVAADLAPTATFQMIKQIPRELLEHDGEEGQALRQQLLRGATVAMFCAGYKGKKFIYHRAAELGVKVVVIDDEDSWAQEMVDEQIIAKFIPIDFAADNEVLFHQALDAIKSLKDDPLVGPVDGVCTFIELAVPMAARLAEALGLPGPSVEYVDIARDKHKTRAIMTAKGLPSIKNFLITDPSQLDQAAEHVGFPAVLKPIAGAASLGVQKVADMDDLKRTYADLVHLMAGLRVKAGALERVTRVRTDSTISDVIDGDGINAERVIALDMMLEEFLDGDEVDVDCLFSDGVCRFCYVIDNGPTVEPYFAETWAALPSLLPEDKVEGLKKMAQDAVTAIGFKNGVFHVEGKFTSRGPRLIEVNARMGGGPTRLIHKHVSGVDLVVEQLLMTVGIPSRPPIEPTGMCIAYAFVGAPKSGVVGNIEFLDKFRDIPAVVQLSALVHDGETLVGPEEGMPSWIAEVVVSLRDGHKAKDLIQSLSSEIAAECLSHM